MRFAAVVITCEHGGNRIPARWRGAFRGRAAAAALRSHRGWDPGALIVARLLAAALKAPLFFSTTSRLLVELNRSTHHARLFSEFSRGLSAEEKDDVVARYYQPYRDEVQGALAAMMRRRGAVLHLSSHSFTPVLGDEVRNADVGILYDSKRPLEKALAHALQDELRAVSDLRVRRNYPYNGASDGFTTYLRRCFPGDKYAGIELEMCQALAPRAYAKTLAQALCTVLSG